MFGFGRPAREIAREARLSALSRSQAMVTLRMDGTIVEANAVFLGLMGYREDEVLGRHHSMFMAAAARESASYRALWGRLKEGQFQQEALEHSTKAGTKLWLQASYSLILDEAGRPSAVLEIANDITRARRETADMLRRLEAIDHAQAVIVFTPDGRIVSANENFLTTMGYRLEELVGQHHGMLMPPGEQESVAYRSFWAALGRGELPGRRVQARGQGRSRGFSASELQPGAGRDRGRGEDREVRDGRDRGPGW